MWIKSWIISALEYMDTDASRQKALVIAKQRPTARTRKKGDLTTEFCANRDARRLAKLQFRLKNLNLCANSGN